MFGENKLRIFSLLEADTSKYVEMKEKKIKNSISLERETDLKPNSIPDVSSKR